MKKYISLIAILFTISFLITACSDNDEQNETADNSNENQTEDEQNNTDQADDSEVENEPDTTSAIDTGETETTNNEDNTDSSNQDEEENALTGYSSEKIEYARVWLQLGVNQEIDELNVRHIPAGEPINPNDETSAAYPEDVIQLAGSRLIDGSITYSGNGDGTINEYNVPLRWDGEYPAGEAFYIDIIENTKLESIDPGKDEAVIELIKLLKIH